MTTDYILDLGEDGKVVIVSQEMIAPTEEGIVEAGLGNEIRERTSKVVDSAADVLVSPLRGVVKLLAHSLPTVAPNDAYQLDEFTVEFEMGIESQIGKDGDLLTGVIAKIMPKGNFKCTYKWSRKEQKAE